MFEGEETAGFGVAAARLEMGACFFAVVEVEVFEKLDGSSPERLMTAMTAIFETPIPGWQHIPRRLQGASMQKMRLEAK